MTVRRQVFHSINVNFSIFFRHQFKIKITAALPAQVIEKLNSTAGRRINRGRFRVVMNQTRRIVNVDGYIRQRLLGKKPVVMVPDEHPAGGCEFGSTAAKGFRIPVGFILVHQVFRKLLELLHFFRQFRAAGHKMQPVFVIADKGIFRKGDETPGIFISRPQRIEQGRSALPDQAKGKIRGMR
ncbi:MAG: hypothetical protein BWY71_02219 [Planctomycetes bacterium ADurb.Bin412]|nr:MAG: hypothetical protein BWY71_02219 [Planctomycetes bacterium ADurb.Bin412]